MINMQRLAGRVTGLAAALAVSELFVGDPSAEVLVVASDQRQANIVLRMAKRMIELNEELAERAQVYAAKIVVPENDAEPLLAELQKILRTPPRWWPDLVVYSEGDIADNYGDAK